MHAGPMAHGHVSRVCPAPRATQNEAGKLERFTRFERFKRLERLERFAIELAIVCYHLQQAPLCV